MAPVAWGLYLSLRGVKSRGKRESNPVGAHDDAPFLDSVFTGMRRLLRSARNDALSMDTLPDIT